MSLMKFYDDLGAIHTEHDMQASGMERMLLQMQKCLVFIFKLKFFESHVFWNTMSFV